MFILRLSHDLKYLLTTGRYYKCWKSWYLKIVSFPPQEMWKFHYFPLRYLSTSGRYHRCWKSWCPKIVSFPTSRNVKISLFSFQVFVNKWKLLQVLKILASNQSLYSHLKKWGNFPIFVQVFVNKWKVSRVLKILVFEDSLFSHLEEMGKFSYFPDCWKNPKQA
jgi:hypothetical protein